MKTTYAEVLTRRGDGQTGSDQSSRGAATGQAVADAAVIIPLPGLGTLDLPREVFERYLRSAAAAEAGRDGPRLKLHDAAELEEITGVPASWWMTQAREHRLPFRKFGKYVRFDAAEIFSEDTYKRLPVQSFNLSVRRGGK